MSFLLRRVFGAPASGEEDGDVVVSSLGGVDEECVEALE